MKGTIQTLRNAEISAALYLYLHLHSSTIEKTVIGGDLSHQLSVGGE